MLDLSKDENEILFVCLCYCLGFIHICEMMLPSNAQMCVLRMWFLHAVRGLSHDTVSPVTANQYFSLMLDQASFTQITTIYIYIYIYIIHHIFSKPLVFVKRVTFFSFIKSRVQRYSLSQVAYCGVRKFQLITNVAIVHY